MYTNAPARSVERKNKGRINPSSFTFYQILNLNIGDTAFLCPSHRSSVAGLKQAWGMVAPWLTIQECCFAPFLFNTRIYPCFHSENQMAQCCCPSATGELLLSSSMLYEADLKSVLLQESFAMLLSNWIQ